MIHLDTNLLVEMVTVGSPGGRMILGWLRAGRKPGASAIAWSEFCNGPLTLEQKEAAFRVLDGRIRDFTWREAEEAARLFNLSGRRRGSHTDCMIGASAMLAQAPLATRNRTDFARLVSFGLVIEAV